MNVGQSTLLSVPILNAASNYVFLMPASQDLHTAGVCIVQPFLQAGQI